MALRGRRINNFLELVDSGVSSTTFQKGNISWPQQPLTEKVLKFNLRLHDSTQKILFSKHKKKS
jgi:hypothetical protein